MFCTIHSNMFHVCVIHSNIFATCLISVRFCAIHSSIVPFLRDPQQYFSFSARSTAVFFFFCAIHSICFIFCAIHSNMFHFLCDPQHPGACSTLGTLWHLGGQGYTSEKHRGIHQKSQTQATPNLGYPWRREKPRDTPNVAITRNSKFQVPLATGSPGGQGQLPILLQHK